MGTCEFSALRVVACTVMMAQEKSVPGMACHAMVLSGRWLTVVLAAAVVGATRMAWLY